MPNKDTLVSKISDAAKALSSALLMAAVLVGFSIGSVGAAIMVGSVLHTVGFGWVVTGLIGLLVAATGFNTAIWATKLIGMWLFPEAFAIAAARQATKDREAAMRNLVAGVMGVDPAELKDFSVRQVGPDEMQDIMEDMQNSTGKPDKDDLN